MIKTFNAAGFGPRLNGVSALSLGKPAAAFPGRVAADADLMIAVDRQQTRLAIPLDASATSMTVENAAAIGAFNLLSIDSEIVKTTGPAAGNVVPVSRGFDGTTPALHLASSVVSGFIDAYHHNSLVAEVEAIEQALGANLSNVLGDSAFLVSTRYIFTPVAPGGSLTVGTNVVTLAPVPKGVNGSDANHYLWISGGTGTPEAVLITGGTAVSGAASGTLFFTCANAHTGAWTIQSATAGIAEAAIVAQGSSGGLITIPAGQHAIRATITLTQGVSILGCGPMASILNQATANMIVFSIGAVYGVQLQGLSVIAHASTNTGYLIVANGSLRSTIDNCWITGGFGAINLKGVFWWRMVNCIIANQTGAQMLCDGPANTSHLNISHCLFAGIIPQPDAGLRLRALSGLYMDDCDFYQCGHALLIDPGAGQLVTDLFIVNTSFDSGTSAGVHVGPSAADAYVMRLLFANCWSATNQNGVFLDQTTGIIRGFQWDGGRIFNNKQGGLTIGAGVSEVLVSNAIIGANSTDASGAYAGIQIGGGASQIQISGCRIGQPLDWIAGAPFTNQQSAGITLPGGASDYVQIHDNRFTGDSQAIFNTSSGTHNSIYANSGYNPLGTSAITVGASPFTHTAGPSPQDVYISGGTVSSITRNGVVVAAASPASIALGPNDSLTVTYSVAPAMARDVH